MDLSLSTSSGSSFSPNEEQQRSKTSLRLKYEAETRVFRAKYGELETVRQNLGLSRRRICQLLLVDPSAWTRWTRSSEGAPPHIYRALEWYILLNQDTHLPRLAAFLSEKGPQRLEHEALMKQVSELRSELSRQRRMVGVALALVGAALLAVAGHWLLG